MKPRGFTLAEMVVVVALVALMTVGIGRLFAGVSEAVGRGMASSELDATARAIEESLRRDIEHMNATESENTFLVIRSVELGGDPDRPIYLSAEDAEADVRDGIAPYEEGSLAIHTRLDEMAFLAEARGADAYRTQQDDGLFTKGQPTAEAARLYYGHGLRPKVDPDWPPPEPAPVDAPAAPLRQFVADGWFGSPPGTDRRDYLPADLDVITGRNQYAGDWILSRQALLLYGPGATGVAQPASAQSSFGEDREYAPYIRDLETLNRFWDNLLADAPGGNENLGWPGPVYTRALAAAQGDTARPDPRLIRSGRVDVCAQSLTDVRRWLEGEDPDWDPADGYGAPAFADVNGTAFGVPTDPGSRLSSLPRYEFNENDLRGVSTESVQRSLWRRAGDAETSPGIPDMPAPPTLLDINASNGPLDDLTFNLIGARSAIAGVLTRPLVEFEAAESTRVEDIAFTGTDADIRYAREHDASMDTHAVLAPRCSRFEISWSDGSYWVRDTDFDNDGTPDARAGELVWYDVSRLKPNDEENTESAERSTFAHLWERFGDNGNGQLRANSPIRWAARYDDPDVQRLDTYDEQLGGHEGEGVELELVPEIGYGTAEDFDSTPTFRNASGSALGRRLWVKTAGDRTEDTANSPAPASNAPYYNPDLTGGVPTPDGWPDAAPASPSDDMREYLAVWPFRTPSSSGEWGDAFEKNVYLRVRFTLHDPLGRVRDGRTYEIVLHVHPHDKHG